MASYPKDCTFTQAVDGFEEIECRVPPDPNAFHRLIGAAEDFTAGARSYLDGLGSKLNQWIERITGL
jgi:hypothetical protein